MKGVPANDRQREKLSCKMVDYRHPLGIRRTETEKNGGMGLQMKLLVANRGEIAVRIMRAAAELGMPTVAVYPKDDAGSLHTGKAEEAVLLQGIGESAYLDIEEIISAARKTGCDAIHPGYSFLAENSKFAQRCEEEGLTFIGPRVETIELFGDKARARVAASAAGVPIIRGLHHAVSLKEATTFLDGLGEGRDMIIKAIAGGGGRGTRVVTRADEVEAVYERCRREAQAAFGNGDVYVEEFMPRVRHVEVQILGDLNGAVAHLVEQARAVNSGGTNFGIDDVIDPADTRSWIAQGLKSVPPVPPRTDKKRPNVDTW